MGLVVLPPVLLLARVPMARREAAIGATTASIVRGRENPIDLRLPDDGENVRHELLCAVAGSGSGTKLVEDAQRVGLEDGERSGCKWCTPGVYHTHC